MEIWIATGNKRELRKKHPYLKDYGIIDIKDIAKSIGYKSSLNLSEYASFILNEEVMKKLDSYNKSRRIYRVLFIVEEFRESLPQEILAYTTEKKLKYESVYIKDEDDFKIVCKNY